MSEKNQEKQPDQDSSTFEPGKLLNLARKLGRG